MEGYFLESQRKNAGTPITFQLQDGGRVQLKSEIFHSKTRSSPSMPHTSSRLNGRCCRDKNKLVKCDGPPSARAIVV